MSNTIDERVLAMKFDNRQFESGIQTSLRSIGQLEKGLQLKGATNGLSELDRATKSLSFEHLANNIDSIASKFTALGMMGVAAMQDIANSVWRTGKQMVSALTVDPIKTGFAEYETQINAVQTILANTQNAGKTLDDVTKALDELNAYADKTIYNFTEMTRNIGTFTAAGVDLDVATNSIQGIANLAAISGSNSQQASTAMYQLSQAMAAGTVKLMDWNSVVNAGMGGQVFQDALKETARAHGVNIDAMIKKYGSFRETLQQGWITTDVLTETLEKFTATTEGLTEEQIKANREMWKARGYTEEQIDAIFEMGKTATDAATKVKTFTQLFDTLKEAAQSGWTQSWEIIVGDFEEAKFLLTAISDEISGIINASAESRNALLQGWKDAGGRDDIIEGLKNMYGLLKDIIKPAKEAFEEIFPPITVDQLKNFTQKFEDFTKKLTVSPAMADKLKRSFKGFFAILDIGAQGLSALASGLAKVIRYALPVGSNLLDMTASLGDFLVELSRTTRETGIFETTMNVIGDAIKFVAGKIEFLTGKAAEAFTFFESVDLSGIEVKFEPIKTIAEAGAWVLDKLQAAFQKALPSLTKFKDYVTDAFGGLSSAVEGVTQNSSISDLASGGLFVALIVGVKKVAKAFEGIGDNVGDILENLAGVFEGVTGALEGMQNRLNAEALKNIAIAIAILAASLFVLSKADPYTLGDSLKVLTAMFVELIGSLIAVTKIASGGNMAKMMAAVKAMNTMSTAVLKLAIAMTVIGSALQKFTSAMVVLGNMDTGSMMNGLLAVVTLVSAMTIAVKKLGDGGTKLLSGAGSLIVFSVAVSILAQSVKALGSMSPEALTAGLAGMAAILLELAAFLSVSKLGSMGIATGAGLMFVAVAVLILASAVRSFGSMDFDALVQGLTVMTFALGALLLAAEVLPKNLISAGVGLMAIASALVIVGVALHIMGSLSLESMAVGLITLGVALTELVIAANLMKGSIGGATAILIMSAALVALGVALKLIGSLSVEGAAIALITLAAALGIIGGAALLLTPVIPALLALSVAVIAFSAAIALGGAALIAFGTGLAAFGVGLVSYANGMVAYKTITVSIIAAIAEQVGAGIIGIANAISAAAPVCGEAISVVIQTIVDILANGVISIANGVSAMGPAVLKLVAVLAALGAASAVLAPLVPAIIAVSAALTTFGIGCAAIAVGVTLLAGALALLGASGLVVASSLSDIYNTINSMGDLSLDAVKSASKTFLSAGKEAAKTVVKGFESEINESGETLSNSLTVALQNGVKRAHSGMASVMTGLATSMTTTLTESYPNFIAVGTMMVTRMISGIESKRSSATSIISEVGAGMKNAFDGYYNVFYSIGSNIVDGLVDGINKNKYEAVAAAKSLATAVKNATKSAVNVNSPSKDFEDIGMWIDMGLANGLTKFANLATNAATQVGQGTIQPVMTMTNDMLSDLGSMGSALRGTASLASSLDSTITSEQYVTVNHSFGELTVKGVNDRNEFVAVANYAVEDMLTELMRKGIRR